MLVFDAYRQNSKDKKEKKALKAWFFRALLAKSGTPHVRRALFMFFSREREIKNLLQQEKFLRRYDKNVKEIYSRMLYDAQKEIEAFYGRYASQEGITISEAKKRVSGMNVEDFSKMAKRMVETKDFSPQAEVSRSKRRRVS